MQSLSELKTSLAEYRSQLATVEAHLGGSEIQGDERGELEQMKTDLVEVIALTEDLVREATPPAAQASHGTLPERGEESGDPATAPSTSSQAGAEVKAKSSSSVPGPVQEEIRNNQARAALTGKGPLHWAVGHRCEAYRLGKGGVAEEGEWSEAHVRSCTADGNVVVEFQRDRHMQEATIATLRPRKEIATEEKYVPVAAPKLAKVGGDDGENQGKPNVPQKLVIQETDDERTRTRKRKVSSTNRAREDLVSHGRTSLILHP